MDAVSVSLEESLCSEGQWTVGAQEDLMCCIRITL